MTDQSIENPRQVTVPAAGTPCPATFPVSAFNLASTIGKPPEAPKEKTRVQRALDHIRECGPATNEDVAKAMGLKPGAHPGSYLALAVKDGRLNTRNGRYHLGTGKPAEARPHQETLPASIATAPAAQVSKPPLRNLDADCATVQIFSTDVAVIARADGSILLSIDGQAVDLTPKQVHLMHAVGALLSQVGVAV